ncbi:MAG: arsenate reductase family protein [Erysipelotrichia bacterium]|nr:arsenate reductase family protein [Erysipelotrichia bacterium]NCC54086.1 arsenate reductase family protein [Erysipelotrichia bacterium]
MNLFICYPKCSTCQKAKKFLEANHIDYTFRDIKEEKLNEEELTTIIKQSQLPVKKFFNTSGLLYKEMKLKDKLKTMSEQEQIKLLASDGMLVKRPLLIGEKQVIVGFKEDTYKTIL